MKPPSESFIALSQGNLKSSIERKDNTEYPTACTNEHAQNRKHKKRIKCGMRSIWRIAQRCVQNLRAENKGTNSRRGEDTQQDRSDNRNERNDSDCEPS